MANAHHHICNKIPKHWQVYYFDGEDKYLLNIGWLLCIEIDYCPYCGKKLEVSK